VDSAATGMPGNALQWVQPWAAPRRLVAHLSRGKNQLVALRTNGNDLIVPRVRLVSRPAADRAVSRDDDSGYLRYRFQEQGGGGSG
jgi:hypothetical protein